MLWHKMGLKEACEPSFPPGHELELKASKRSNKRRGEAPTYLAHTSGKISANIPPPPPLKPCLGCLCVWGGGYVSGNFATGMG